jgi:signal transduction histidine kinase
MAHSAAAAFYMTRNRLIDTLDRDLAAELPMATVELETGQLVHQPSNRSEVVYFPVTAVISLVSTMENGASAEVGLVGREGFVGVAAVLGALGVTTTAVVLVAGTALTASASDLRRLRAHHTSAREVIDLYIQAHLIQLAQTAACNRLHAVDARLARWLLAVHDRIDGDQFTVSQEVIAQMVGAHRPTVAASLLRLEGQNIVKHSGRALVIADRAQLEAIACECHRVVRREFERLLWPGGASTQREAPGPPSAGTSDAQPSPALESMREITGRLLLASIREQEARQAAEAANRAKDEFLAMVSHELRTPLNAILGWCSLLASGHAEPPKRGLEVIERNARAQLKLVNDLLDAARISSGSLVVLPEPLDLAEVVRETASTLQPLARQKNITLDVTIEDDVPAILADAERVQQVLLNVLGNAIKFTKPAGSVAVRLTRTDSGAQIVIRDTGDGISPHILPHVFERFRQGEVRAGQQRGVGLGLTISRALIELHGGTIHLSSDGEGQGTTCTIDLPLTPPAAPELRSARP